MVHGTMAGSQSMVDSQPWGGVAAPSLGGHHNSSEREREREREEVIRHSRKVAGGATMGIWF
jgi:hypothetical protein